MRNYILFILLFSDEWGVQLPEIKFIPLNGFNPKPFESDNIQSNQQTAPALTPDNIIPFS